MAIAKTLQELPDSDVIRRLKDRKEDLDLLIEEILEEHNPRLSDRSNVTLLEAGEEFAYLDLFCALRELRDKDAKIHISDYNNRGPSRSGTLDSRDRGGDFLEIVSNQKYHSFNILLKDEKTLRKTSSGTFQGLPKNFQVVDPGGYWYGGMGVITASGEGLEEEFQRFYHPREGMIRFRKFVAEERAASMYGAPKWVLLASILRIEDESSAHRKLAAKINEKLKIHISPSERRRPGYSSNIFDQLHHTGYSFDDEHTEKIKVEGIVTTMGGFSPQGPYPIKALDLEGKVRVVYDEQQYLPRGNWKSLFDTDTWKDILRFATWRKNLTYSLAAHRMRALSRAIDLAYYKNPAAKPSWEVPEWKSHTLGSFMQTGYLFLNRMLKTRTVDVMPGVIDPSKPAQDLYIE